MTSPDTQDTEELKPCPFCGGEAHTERVRGAGVTLATCNELQCGSVVAPTKAAVIAKWNTRPDSPVTVTDEMIEAGCAAMHKMSDEMLARERSKTPQDMPDYDEGDLCRVIFQAMAKLSQGSVDDDQTGE